MSTAETEELKLPSSKKKKVFSSPPLLRHISAQISLVTTEVGVGGAVRKGSNFYTSNFHFKFPNLQYIPHSSSFRRAKNKTCSPESSLFFR